MSEKRQCAGRVAGGGWGRRDCAAPAKYEEDGKWWCGVHVPSRVEAKRVAKLERWEAERLRRNAEWAEQEARREREAALAAATEELVQAALEWDKSGNPWSLGRLMDAVAAYRKARGEGA